MNDDINADFMKDIHEMVTGLQALTKEAVLLIEPQVNNIIRNKIKDSNQIETLLDRLIDYAGMDEKGLCLFKRLCRYYYPINPRVTTDYVYDYRDLYDSDEIEDDI